MFDSLNYNLEILGSSFCAPTFFFGSLFICKILENKKIGLTHEKVKNTCKKKMKNEAT